MLTRARSKVHKEMLNDKTNNNVYVRLYLFFLVKKLIVSMFIGGLQYSLHGVCFLLVLFTGVCK